MSAGAKTPQDSDEIMEVDAELAKQMQHATDILKAAGLTVQDVLNELPAARAEIMRAAYSAEFVRELERLHQAAQLAEGRDALST